MEIRIPKNSDKYKWTNHVLAKMQYYGLSESRIIRTIRSPNRVEEGIAPETIAVMQVVGSKKHLYEVWVMYQEINNGNKTKKILKTNNTKYQYPSSSKTIISAWRYPGVSPIDKEIPIPDDIRAELEIILQN